MTERIRMASLCPGCAFKKLSSRARARSREYFCRYWTSKLTTSQGSWSRRSNSAHVAKTMSSRCSRAAQSRSWPVSNDCMFESKSCLNIGRASANISSFIKSLARNSLVSAPLCSVSSPFARRASASASALLPSAAATCARKAVTASCVTCCAIPDRYSFALFVSWPRSITSTAADATIGRNSGRIRLTSRFVSSESAS